MTDTGEATIVCELHSRLEVADGTMAFHFAKPTNWAFKAGQFLDMTLLDPEDTDAKGNVRSFSIASAPHEETLMITTRMRDTAFKRTLKTMPLGTRVRIQGPSGELVLRSDPERPAVFLAGGIGITPFRSMLVDAAHRKLSQRLFLFYSNRRPEDAAFLEELQELQTKTPGYTMIASMSDMAKSHRPWTGETGVIDHPMISRHLGGIGWPVYYIAGPPQMVKDLHAMLTKQSVSDADIHAEEFSGY